MSIRSELSLLADNIHTAAASYHGGKKISLGEVDTLITDLGKSILGDPSHAIKGKIEIYEGVEKSLKGRIETAQKLAGALEELRNKASDSEELSALQQMIQRVKTTVSTATHLQQDLARKIPKYVQDKVIDFIKSYSVDLPLEEKITKNAFRTIKDLSVDDRHFANDKMDGSFPLMSYVTLQQDLNKFLASYNKFLTDSQRSLITEVFPLLAKGTEISKEILRLIFFRQGAGVAEEVIEAGIADIAYDIEKSIDSLKNGATFIFPGGYSYKGGHSILYEVQRVRDGEYHFSIFNTGLGAGFGQNFLQQIKVETCISNQYRVPLFSKFKKEALVDRSFLAELIRFQIMDTPNEMDAVHGAILKQFKDKFSAEMTLREPHDLQTWGTCSYDSVAAFLQYKLPSSLFIPFHYDMMLRARGELNDQLKQQGNCMINFLTEPLHRAASVLAVQSEKIVDFGDLR